MSKVIVYKLDGKGWGVALNPETNCVIWHFDLKRKALEKAAELEVSA
jgi:hypothetical protein